MKVFPLDPVNRVLVEPHAYAKSFPKGAGYTESGFLVPSIGRRPSYGKEAFIRVEKTLFQFFKEPSIFIFVKKLVLGVVCGYNGESVWWMIDEFRVH